MIGAWFALCATAIALNMVFNVCFREKLSDKAYSWFDAHGSAVFNTLIVVGISLWNVTHGQPAAAFLCLGAWILGGSGGLLMIYLLRRARRRSYRRAQQREAERLAHVHDDDQETAADEAAVFRGHRS